MSFQLEVEFSGLCLYVVDATNRRVGVAMPDARGRTPGSTTHADGTLGKRHVGYVRFDLSDLDPRFPPLGSRTPFYEGVHLFDRESLEFVLQGNAGDIVSSISLPEAEKIAPDGSGGATIVPIPNLFSGTPPEPVLMHTLLEGGEIVGDPEETWRIPNLWNPGQDAYEVECASFVTWRRLVDSVSLRIRRFGAAPNDYVEIPLAPRAPSTVVRVKIANFCATNPLEWRDLGLRDVDSDDEDFKWLYRLLRPHNGATWQQKLQKHRFPIPTFIPGGTGVQDCLGMQTQGSTT